MYVTLQQIKRLQCHNLCILQFIALVVHFCCILLHPNKAVLQLVPIKNELMASSDIDSDNLILDLEIEDQQVFNLISLYQTT